MGDDRPNVYIEDSGLVVYRASSVGMCVKALVAIAHGGYEEAMGQERVEMLNRTAVEGNVHEEAVRQKLASEGWIIHSTQDTVDVPVIQGVIIRGHIDGHVSIAKGQPPMLLEVKSMSNKRFDRWVKQGFTGFVKYAYQISIYMQAFPDQKVVYIAKRREDGFEDRRIIEPGVPPIAWKEIRKKVLTAEGFRRKRGGGFPACDVPASEQWWCPFWYLHDEKADDEGEPPTEEMKAILAELIPRRAELSEIESQGKQAESERKALDKEILNLLGNADTLLVTVDDIPYQITRVSGGGSSLDSAMLKSDLGEEFFKYEKPYKFQYPKITAKKMKPKKESE